MNVFVTTDYWWAQHIAEQIVKTDPKAVINSSSGGSGGNDQNGGEGA